MTVGLEEGAPAHGGSLAAAARLFPDAPRPFVDLSTGINPHPYSVPPIPASAFGRLPEPEAERALRRLAAALYGAPSDAFVAAAPGTQILLPRVAALVAPGEARVLSPTYAEHARAAALAGHAVREVASLAEMEDARLAVLVNPNNPDGRLFASADLLDLARALRRRAGLLVVDEAFMDVVGEGVGLAPALERHDNLVVLRSFGKFFGLAGVRLGFALAAPSLAARLRDDLGPWAVSGPALHVAGLALADRDWQGATRRRLAAESRALDAALARAGLDVRGGTALFRFLHYRQAGALFERAGRAGLYLRRFERMPDALRIGLPPDGEALLRLERALGGPAR